MPHEEIATVLLVGMGASNFLNIPQKELAYDTPKPTQERRPLEVCWSQIMLACFGRARGVVEDPQMIDSPAVYTEKALRLDPQGQRGFDIFSLGKASTTAALPF